MWYASIFIQSPRTLILPDRRIPWPHYDLIYLLINNILFFHPNNKLFRLTFYLQTVNYDLTKIYFKLNHTFIKKNTAYPFLSDHLTLFPPHFWFQILFSHSNFSLFHLHLIYRRWTMTWRRTTLTSSWPTCPSWSCCHVSRIGRPCSGSSTSHMNYCMARRKCFIIIEHVEPRKNLCLWGFEFHLEPSVISN